jgi:hypothetical protein
MFAVMFVGGAFAQRVGDVVQFQGQSYRVEESRDGRVVLQEVRGHGGGGNRPSRGKRYEAVDELLTWAQADADAKRRGGHLAVITSDAEQRDIERLIATGKSYWLGANRDKDDLHYKWENGDWATGERARYTNWKSGFPERKSGYNKIYLSSKERGKWVDGGGNSYKIGYILEWDR